MKRYAVTPSLLCVKTDRQMAAALKLAERLEKEYSLEKSPGSGDGPEDYGGCCPSRELLARAWCRAETRNRSETAGADLAGRSRNASRFSRRWREISQRRDPAHRPAGKSRGEEITLGVREEPIMPELAGEAGGADKEPTAEAEYFQAAATLDEAQEIMAEEAVAEAADNGLFAAVHAVSCRHGLQPPGPEGRGRCGSFLGGQQDKRRS